MGRGRAGTANTRGPWFEERRVEEVVPWYPGGEGQASRGEEKRPRRRQRPIPDPRSHREETA